MNWQCQAIFIIFYDKISRHNTTLESWPDIPGNAKVIRIGFDNPIIAAPKTEMAETALAMREEIHTCIYIPSEALKHKS